VEPRLSTTRAGGTGNFPHDSITRAHAIHRLLGYLYPPSLWSDYGDQMLADFRDGCREHQGNLWLWVAGDLLQGL
jgi:hypothetical protein